MTHLTKLNSHRGYTRDQLRKNFPTKSDAWIDGFANGRADRLLGIALDVAIYPDQSDYSREYTDGYRAGNRKLADGT